MSGRKKGFESIPSIIIALLCFCWISCSGDADQATRKICTAGAMRDCVCTDTSSGQQSCNENGTSYGLCVCGHVATDGGEANQDAGAANDDASMTMRGDGGGMMMRGDGGGMMMRRDGSGMMMGRDGGGMMMPPQEAYDACTGKMEGDDCTWNNPRRGEVMGTCQYRRGESQLFCRRMGGGGMGGGGMGGGGMGGGGGN